MSGLFGGGASQSMTPQRYNGIQISSSASGGCVPLMYGQQRLPFNLIWYGAFTSSANSSSGGGKGGGGSQTTGYTYKSSFACALCEGPISTIVQVWNDKDLTTLSALGLTLFTGAGGQSPWSYLTTNFPTQAIPYDHICYVAAQSFTLGDSAAMPNITFETRAFLTGTGTVSVTFTTGPAAGATSAVISSSLAAGQWSIYFSDNEVRWCTVAGSAVTWQGALNAACTTQAYAGCSYDADPSLMVVDYLTDPNHGVGFPAGQIATLTGANSYQSYCYSLGLFLSPFETTQRAASDFLKEIFQITNSDAVWSAGTLKVLPYCDAPVSGNGQTYTPNLTPEFIFTDDDFLDIPELTRIPIPDTYNHVRVEYLDRSNAYNTAVAEATDLGNIAQTGERVMDTLSFHEITSSTVARVVAQLVLQVSLYERNTIKVKVRADYCLLEPMDYIGITDVALGYVGQIFRITKVTDDDKDEIELEAMEIPGTVRTTPVYNWASVAGYNANFGEAPGSVQAPAFLEAYGVIVSPTGGRQLWITVDGPSGSAAWGGAQVFMSFDGTTYDPIGIITGAGRYGTITSSVAAITSVPDVTTTMSVTLNNTNAVLGTGSAADALDNRLLIAVGSGASVEIMSYETATLVSAGEYTITTLYRGLYSTDVIAHAPGAQFMRLDGNVLQMNIDPGWLGQTVYFKFCSFNTVGRATQLLSAATAYTYTLGQSLVAYNAVSTSTFSTTGNCAVYSPTSGFKMTTGAAAWDSSIYSAQGYTNGSTAECYPSQTTANIMLGVTLSPLAVNSYTNLAYAWYMEVGGTLTIYESGTLIGSFGTYTSQDLLAIVYDGKHVAYYHNATLVRSVPIANQTFYLQVFFYTPGGSVYGLSYDTIATAVTPFTLVPMATTVAAAGTTALSNSTGTNGFGTKNFRSKESLTNGAICSASGAQTNGALFFGFSTAPATGGPSYGPIVAGWYLHGDSNACDILFTGTDIGTYGTGPLLTDTFTIAYDNFYFYWYRNNVLILQEPFTSAGPLYLFGDFFEANLALIDLSFAPYSPATPQQFISRGTVVVSDTNVSKATNDSLWTSGDAYSINGYPSCHLVWKANQTTSNFMVSLVTTIPATINYTALTYAMQCNSSGNLEIYESGTLIATYGAYTTSDFLSIVYDGATLIYAQNGTALRTVSIGVATMFADVNFYNSGGLNSLEFAATSTIPLADTSQINTNAVTAVIISTVSSVNVPNSSIGTQTLITSITAGPYPFPSSVVCTATGQLSTGSSGASAVAFYSLSGTVSGGNVVEQTAGNSYNGGMAVEATFALPANTTATFDLYGIGLPGTSIASYTVVNLTLKGEVIKR
jgi:hypothetical protein